MLRLTVLAVLLTLPSSAAQADLISPTSQSRSVYADATMADEQLVEATDFGVFDEAVRADGWGTGEASQRSEILPSSAQCIHEIGYGSGLLTSNGPFLVAKSL